MRGLWVWGRLSHLTVACPWPRHWTSSCLHFLRQWPKPIGVTRDDAYTWNASCTLTWHRASSESALAPYLMVAVIEWDGVGEVRLLARGLAQSGHSVHGRWCSSFQERGSQLECASETCTNERGSRRKERPPQPRGQGRHWNEGFCPFLK